MTGIWTTEAPLGTEQTQEDRAVLASLVLPEGVVLESMVVWVNQHKWEFHGHRTIGEWRGD